MHYHPDHLHHFQLHQLLRLDPPEGYSAVIEVGKCKSNLFLFVNKRLYISQFKMYFCIQTIFIMEKFYICSITTYSSLFLFQFKFHLLLLNLKEAVEIYFEEVCLRFTCLKFKDHKDFTPIFQ